MSRVLVGLVMLVALPALSQEGAGPQVVSPQTAGAPDFSGRYTLNTAESEDARQKLPPPGEGRGPEGRSPRGGGPPPGGPPPGGGFGGRRPGGMGPAGGPGDGGREAMRGLFEAPKGLSITHTPNEIAVLEQDGRLRTFHPDGKTYKSEGGANEVKTRWDGAQLVVETKTPGGAKLTETWRLDPTTRKLTIVSRLAPPSREAVEIRRVYDPEIEGDSSRTAPGRCVVHTRSVFIRSLQRGEIVCVARARRSARPARRIARGQREPPRGRG